MNLKPVFTVADATRNLHRMDASLLESFMTRHNGGLQLLAGTNVPSDGRSFHRRICTPVRHARDALSLCRGRCLFPLRRSQPADRQPVRDCFARGLQRCRVALERGPRAAISRRDRQPRARSIGAESLSEKFPASVKPTPRPLLAQSCSGESQSIFRDFQSHRSRDAGDGPTHIRNRTLLRRVGSGTDPQRRRGQTRSVVVVQIGLV